MLKMQYKSFVWPNNPQSYTLRCERQTALQKVPMGGFTVQELGRSCMVLHGEGEFFGADAMQQMRELMRVFRQEGAGVLIHPAWTGGTALFTQLRLTQEPREDYVAYEFEFCESAGEDAQERYEITQRRGRGGKIYYSVKSGENAWQVCARHALTMEELLAMNPSIASPTGLAAGQKVRVQ